MNWLLDSIWKVYSSRGARRSFYPQSQWLFVARSSLCLTCLVAIGWLTSILIHGTIKGLPALGFTALALLGVTLVLNIKAYTASRFIFMKYFVLIPGASLVTLTMIMTLLAMLVVKNSAISILVGGSGLLAALCWARCTTADPKIPGSHSGYMR